MTENLFEKMKKIKVVAIVGPTASGKTSYAIDYAKQHNGEIISADSRLVYKGFDIGTAKPTPEERQGIKHYLIDIVDPTYDYSVVQFVKDAEKAITEIVSKGKLPIITGGTGLYLKGLLEGYDFPEMQTDYELREKLKQLEVKELYDELSRLDPVSAQNIEQNDKKKIIRALEVIKSLNRPLSEVRGVKEHPYDVEWIGLNFPRNELYERINKRVDMMLELGLVEETERLLDQYGRIQNLLHTIGYQEIIAHLDGIMTLEEAADKLKQNTRNYAKRQLTWFRKNENIKWNCYPEKLKK